MPILRDVADPLRVPDSSPSPIRFRTMNPNVVPSAAHTSTDEPNAPAALVLVVDDEPLVRNVIGRELQRRGYRALLAADGQEGLDLFAKHGTDIKLVVLDWHLPGRSGQATQIGRAHV